MTRILVVDNYDSFVYNLVHYLGELGAEPEVHPGVVVVEKAGGNAADPAQRVRVAEHPPMTVAVALVVALWCGPAFGQSAAPEWIAPPLPMLDPDKEVAANRRAVRAGQKTQQAVLRELGLDPDDVIAELVDWNRKIDAAGLVLDSDPRMMSESGQKHGATTAAPSGDGGDKAGDGDKAGGDDKADDGDTADDTADETADDTADEAEA